MTTRTRVAAAASTWVRERLAGPVRDVVVVHAGPQALYVAVPDGSATWCVGVLSRSAVVVPCGLRTVLPDLSVLAAPHEMPAVGDVLRVGDGHLGVGACDIGVVRILDTSVPDIVPAAAGAMAARLRAVAGSRLDPVRAELPEPSLARLAQGDSRAVPMLLGRGSGLTPVGDDVLAGWLASLHAGGVAPGPVAHQVATLAAGSTTLLSATLLDRAADGDVLPAFQRLVLDLRPSTSGRSDARLAADVEHLLGVGHTSGAGLMLGCLLALDHLSHVSPHARRQ